MSLYSRFKVSAYTQKKKKNYYEYANKSLEYPTTVLVAMLNQDTDKTVVIFRNQFELTTEHNLKIK